jgi:hypothetical protein
VIDLPVCCFLLQDAAAAVGKKVAQICAEKSISKVCFDRGGFTYHGRIKVRGHVWVSRTAAAACMPQGYRLFSCTLRSCMH